MGPLLLKRGYVLRVFDLVDPAHSEDVYKRQAKTTPATCEGGGKTVHVCEGCGLSLIHI